jgi:hypothetical protein
MSVGLRHREEGVAQAGALELEGEDGHTRLGQRAKGFVPVAADERGGQPSGQAVRRLDVLDARGIRRIPRL